MRIFSPLPSISCHPETRDRRWDAVDQSQESGPGTHSHSPHSHGHEWGVCISDSIREIAIPSQKGLRGQDARLTKRCAYNHSHLELRHRFLEVLLRVFLLSSPAARELGKDVNTFMNHEVFRHHEVCKFFSPLFSPSSDFWSGSNFSLPLILRQTLSFHSFPSDNYVTVLRGLSSQTGTNRNFPITG